MAELLIAFGIAVLGYRLSKNQLPPPALVPPRQPVLRSAGAYAGGERQHDPEGIHRALAETRWRDALDPKATGVVDSTTYPSREPMPFFKSARKQNTNDAVKQTRMELFTGALDADTSVTGVYRKKQEVRLFKPGEMDPHARQAVTSSGTHGNAPTNLDSAQERSWVSGLQNNVVPATQVRIGPGLGLGACDTTGADGFHPMLRVLPKNVGEYRKNNLPGRINHGAAPVGERAAGPGEATATERPGPVFWELERRPLMNPRAPVDAHERRPHNTRRNALVARGTRPVQGQYFGGAAGAAGAALPGRANDPLATRDRPDDAPPLPAMNVTVAEIPRPGGFMHKTFDMARFDATLREERDLGRAGVLTGAVRRGIGPTNIAAPAATLRDSAHVAGLPRGFVAGGLGTAMGVRSTAPWSATLRELSHAGGADCVANPRGIYVHAPRGDLVPAEAGGLDRNAKRAKYSDQTRHAGPARVNVRRDAHEAGGAVRVRRLRPSTTDLGALPTLSVPLTARETGELTTTFNKLPSNNPRIRDLGLERAALCNNEYALPIN